MAVAVERFAPDPTAGRPRVAEFRHRVGRLAVHCSREDGSLWLFATGPSGGKRGEVVVPLRRAGDLVAWLDADERGKVFSGGRAYLVLRESPPPDVAATVVVGGANGTRRLSVPFDAHALAELRACLREWALAAGRVPCSP